MIDAAFIKWLLGPVSDVADGKRQTTASVPPRVKAALWEPIDRTGRFAEGS
jgi:hypothetical protein